METYRGLVLAERNAGDRGKFLDILLENNTVQEVFCRGGKRNTSAGLAATQLFSYATFSLTRRQQQVYLDSCEPIHIFYRLRNSLSRLSLALYFAELVRGCIQSLRWVKDTSDVMWLLLNTLYFLEGGLREEALLKPLFELRLMTELGMMPDLLICRTCNAYCPSELVFSVEGGCFYCRDCVPERMSPKWLIPLRAPALLAMRHIVFADKNRLFNFRLGTENLAALGRCTERFVQYYLPVPLRTLTFYHNIVSQGGATSNEQSPSNPGIS